MVKKWLSKVSKNKACLTRLPDPYDFYDTDKAVLSVANSHVATHGPTPSYMNLVEVGGIHCTPGKELPPDLKAFMDSHPEGVVLVSFGSALSASQLSKDQLDVFQSSFRDLAIPIIWKWDSEDLSGQAYFFTKILKLMV